jgi:hypothetical protein
MNPSNALKELNLSVNPFHLDNEGLRVLSERAVREIRASLVGNTQLKTVRIHCISLRGRFQMNYFESEKLLCVISRVLKVFTTQTKRSKVLHLSTRAFKTCKAMFEAQQE